LGPNFTQETDLSGDGEGEAAGEEGGWVCGELAGCARHGWSTAQAISNKKVAWKRWIATRSPGRQQPRLLLIRRDSSIPDSSAMSFRRQSGLSFYLTLNESAHI
jgi:predicted RNase H-like HicB family nuclease